MTTPLIDASVVPTAGQVGLLPMFTEFVLVVTMFSFLGMTIFSLASLSHVSPDHRTSSVLTAVICAVAGTSYFVIRTYFHQALLNLPTTLDPAARHDWFFSTYLGAGQFRYMDWAVTTPLLLVKNVLLLRVRPRQVAGELTTLVCADLFMIVTGYLGEQQLGPHNEVLANPRLVWGFISSVGYGLIPIILFRIYRRFAAGADPEERLAYKILAYATVTTWGVYPLGYLVPVLFPQWDLNWVHVAFSVADVVNKVGAGVVAYLAGAKAFERIARGEATGVLKPATAGSVPVPVTEPGNGARTGQSEPGHAGSGVVMTPAVRPVGAAGERVDR